MIIDEIVGHTFDESFFAWGRELSVLYAIAIGIADSPHSMERFGWGVADPACFPTLGTLASDRNTIRGLLVGGARIASDAVLYASHEIEVLSDVPSAGRVVTRARVTDAVQAPKGVFVTRESTSSDVATGAPVWRNRVVSYVRGATLTTERPSEGRSGLTSLPSSVEPCFVAHWSTGLDQAMVYGLTGDMNPIHGSTEAARAAGLDQPILHGLCGFGGVVRVLLDGLAGGDETRLRAAHVDFVAPVHPGESLNVRAYDDDAPARRGFEVRSGGHRRMVGWIDIAL